MVLNMRCAVAKCKTDNNVKAFKKDFMFFRFPNDEKLRKEWLNACKRRDHLNTDNARICSKHFPEESYERNLKFELLGYSAKNRRLLKKDAVPTLNIPDNPIEKLRIKREIISRREKQLKKRKPRQIIHKILDKNLNNDDISARTSSADNNNYYNNVVLLHDSSPTGSNNGNVWTNSGHNDEADLIAKLRWEIENLKNENDILKSIQHSVVRTNKIKKLKESYKKITWKMKDISRGIVLYSAGARAYRLLLKKGYPLPAVATLHCWCGKIKVEPENLR